MPLYNPSSSGSFTSPVSGEAVKTEVSLVDNATTELVAENLDRKGLTFFNKASSDAYIDTDDTMGTGSFMFKLVPNGFYEMPSNPLYKGAFHAILDSGTGSIEIREFI